MKKITTLLCSALMMQSVANSNFIQAYKDRADPVTQTNITNNLREFQ